MTLIIYSKKIDRGKKRFTISQYRTPINYKRSLLHR